MLLKSFGSWSVRFWCKTSNDVSNGGAFVPLFFCSLKLNSLHEVIAGSFRVNLAVKSGVQCICGIGGWEPLGEGQSIIFLMTQENQWIKGVHEVQGDQGVHGYHQYNWPSESNTMFTLHHHVPACNSDTS